MEGIIAKTPKPKDNKNAENSSVKPPAFAANPKKNTVAPKKDKLAEIIAMIQAKRSAGRPLDKDFGE